jgi:hypothetical protein
MPTITPPNAFSDIGSSGDTILVSGQTGYRIVVDSYKAQGEAATKVYFKTGSGASGSNVAISETIEISGDGGGANHPPRLNGYFRTAAGEDLAFNNLNAVMVHVRVTWFYERVG